jgi:hypothetical protein
MFTNRDAPLSSCPVEAVPLCHGASHQGTGICGMYASRILRRKRSHVETAFGLRRFWVIHHTITATAVDVIHGADDTKDVLTRKGLKPAYTALQEPRKSDDLTTWLHNVYLLTVLMAEQNFHQAIKIADRGYIIVHGRIEFEGRTAQELSENTLVKQYYLGV